ncbi:WD40-repeat-containing domain protein, partial [Earliella scabrosa]
TAYVAIHTLTSGHSDTVNCLSFSPDGTHLASGGDDYALIIWNAQKGRLLYRFLCKAPVGCVIWHPVHPETVVVGCDNGYLFQAHDFHLVNYTENPIHLGAQGTVQCLEYNAASQYLAVGMGTEVYVTREVSRSIYKGAQKYPPPAGADEASVDPETRLRPVALHFLDNGKKLVVSYLNHGIVCWDTHSQDELWTISPPDSTPKIGGSALSPNSRSIVVYNMATGLDRYIVGSRGKPRQAYKLVSAPRCKLTVRTAFLHGGRAIICGTTTGAVCIWNVGDGEHFQILQHEGLTGLSYITVERGAFHYIATGTAGKGQATYIKIWRAKI